MDLITDCTTKRLAGRHWGIALRVTASLLGFALWPGSAVAADYARHTAGQTADGQAIEAVDLSAGRVRVTILTLGATIQSVTAPDRNGDIDDIVLGYDSAADYVAHPNYFGATLGRVANRIAGGRFTLDGKEYRLPTNNGPNTLHGGPVGFDKRLWRVIALSRSRHQAEVTLQLISADGDQGFPGTLRTRVTYALDDQGALSIRYQATTDKPTIVSLSNHSYWNLAGARSDRGAMGLLLTIPAASFTPLGADHVPTGEVRSVVGTPFDFVTPTPVGARLGDTEDAQLKLGHGYDHNWLIAMAPAAQPRPVARLEDPVSGRVVDVSATTPGLQMFSASGFNGSIIGKDGKPYGKGAGIALEPQMVPDTPHHPEFGSIRLDPGQRYDSRIVFRFSIVRPSAH